MPYQFKDNGFRKVPRTGVIYVMARARAHGFHYGHQEWANLGQGAPQTDDIPGSPERLHSLSLDHSTSEYSPVAGDETLRQAVADLYNARYRQGRRSQYSYENVAISGGGRLALTRIAATLGNINLGHFLPDYTAYEELLNTFSNFISIPIPYNQRTGFRLSAREIESFIINMGLGAILLSNPCNPTGQLLAGERLSRLIEAGKQDGCSLIFDEFYSHYIYDREQPGPLSASAYVKNVNEDNVLVVDGLTKNWRYPGLRLSWTLGPKQIIEGLASAGSFLDGGAVHAVQKAALPLIDRAYADQEAAAIRSHFAAKRDYMVRRLREMGFVMQAPPRGSFYCFPSLEAMPPPLRDGMAFFNELLKYRVICVPGEFFDVNPGNRRKNLPSRLKGYVRFSFGPPMHELVQGLDQVETMLRQYR